MFWEKLAVFGNTEVHRVRNPNDTIGFANQILNRLGAVLRNLMVIWYTFPDPVELGTRTGSKGKQFRIIGYSKNYIGPEVSLIHSENPSWDFGDVYRNHLQLLGITCYIYDVPLDDISAYGHLFSVRIKPYLDYLYTEYRMGIQGFKRGAQQELARIKREIKALYVGKNGLSPTVTKQSDFRKVEADSILFMEQIADALDSGIEHPLLSELIRIASIKYHEDSRYEQGCCLTENDVHFINEKIAKSIRILGSRVHESIRKALPTPRTLEQANWQGDDLANEDGFLLCSEMSVDTSLGKGRADLALLRRDVSRDARNIVWRPVMVIDIKTRTSSAWDFGAEWIESESRHLYNLHQRVVPKFHIRTRYLDDKEWQSAIKSTPRKSDRDQIEAYAKALAAVQSDASIEVNDSDKILKATLVIDTAQNVDSIKKIIRPFVIRVFKRTIQKERIRRTLFEPIMKNGEQIRSALVVHQQPFNDKWKQEPVPCSWKELYDPLKGASSNGRRFILYLSERVDNSGGVTGARIASQYHGAEWLFQFHSSQPVTNIVWLDLVNEYSENVHDESQTQNQKIVQLLTETRLRLIHLPEPLHEEYKKFLKSIKIHPLFQEIDQFLFKGNRDVASLISGFLDDGKPKMIVVSGWDILGKAVPSHYRHRLKLLKHELISNLPNEEGVTVLWFDDPKHRSDASVPYRRRVLIPYYDNSDLRGHVNEIIWNLPAPLVPFVSHDDIRVIINQNLQGFDMDFALIPPLNGWSRRFRAEQQSEVKDEHIEVDGVIPDAIQKDAIKAQVLTLLPWLVDLWPDQAVIERDEKIITAKELYEKTREVPEFSISGPKELKGAPTPEPRLLQKLRFQPRGGSEGKGYADTTHGRINSARVYHSHYKIKAEPPSESTFAPRLSCLQVPEPTALKFPKTIKKQVTLIQETVKYLISMKCRKKLSAISQKTGVSIEQLTTLLNQLQSIVQKEDDILTLQEIRKELSTNKLTSEFWNLFSRVQFNPDTEGFSRAQIQDLSKLYDDQPMLRTHCGLHLSILLSVVAILHPNLTSNHLRLLWNVLQPWHLLHIGLREEYLSDHTTGLSKFKVENVWNDLLQRTEFFLSNPEPPDPDVMFGLKLSSEERDYEWVAILDSMAPLGVRLGLFRKRDRDVKGGDLEWSITRLDMVHDEVSELTKYNDETYYVFRRNYSRQIETESGNHESWDVWERRSQKSKWTQVGSLERVFRLRSATISLRAFSISFGEKKEGNQPSVRIPPNFLKLVTQAIRQTAIQLQNTKHVNLKLSLDKDDCVVEFLDSDSKSILHSLKIKTVVDIIRLLRYPMTAGQSLRLKNDLFVTWNPFHDFAHIRPDIEYGKLEFLRPFVTRNLPDDESRYLPVFISDAVSEKRPLTVTIFHDSSICPIIISKKWDHEDCWGIRCPPDNKWPEEFSDHLELSNCTDEEVSTSIHRLSQLIAKRQLRIEFDYGPDQDDRMVFNESDFMRELSKEYRHIPMPKMKPGRAAYLKSQQELRKKKSSK
jgi:hypothetical protein